MKKRKAAAKNWSYVREPCPCKTRKALQNVLFQHEVMNFKGEHTAERKAPGMSLGESKERLWELIKTGVVSIDLARAQKANGTYELNEPSFMIINTSALFVHVKQHLLDDEKMMKDRVTLTHLMKEDDSDNWSVLCYNQLRSKLYTKSQDAKLFDDADHVGYYVQPIKDLDNEHPHPLVVQLDKTEKPTLFASRKSTRLLWDCRSKHVVAEISGYMSFDSVPQLEEMMISRGIDPTEYEDSKGNHTRKGGPANQRRHAVKTLDELFCELILRNSQLYAHPESEGGAVVRVENLLTLKIQQAGKLLVQTHQQLADGRVQEMWQLLGCKLPPQELGTPLDTALRAIKQELGLEAEQIKLVEESYTKSRETPSDGQGMYPGIMTQQVRHTINAFTEALPVTEGAGTFVTIDKMSHDRNLRNRKIFWALYSENVWLTMCHNFLKVKPQEELLPIKYKNISHRVNSIHMAKKEVGRVMGHMRRLSMVGIAASASKLKHLGHKAHAHLNPVDAAAAATAAHRAMNGDTDDGDKYMAEHDRGKGRRMSIVHVGSAGGGKGTSAGGDPLTELVPLAETHVKLYDDHEQFIKTKVDMWLSQKILKPGGGDKALAVSSSRKAKQAGGGNGKTGGQKVGRVAAGVLGAASQQQIAAAGSDSIVNLHVRNLAGFGNGRGGGGGAASAGRDKFRGRGVPFWTRSRSRKPGARARAERAKRARERQAAGLSVPASSSQNCLDGDSWHSLDRMGESAGKGTSTYSLHSDYSGVLVGGRSRDGLPGIEKKLSTLDMSMSNVPASACSGAMFKSTSNRFKPQKEDYFFEWNYNHKTVDKAQWGTVATVGESNLGSKCNSSGMGAVAYKSGLQPSLHGKETSTASTGSGGGGRRTFNQKDQKEVW
jgi:hypothetical protein